MILQCPSLQEQESSFLLSCEENDFKGFTISSFSALRRTEGFREICPCGPESPSVQAGAISRRQQGAQ